MIKGNNIISTANYTEVFLKSWTFWRLALFYMRTNGISMVILLLVLMVLFQKATSYLKTLKHSYLVYYTLNKEKIPWHKTSLLKADLKPLKTRLQNWHITINSWFTRTKKIFCKANNFFSISKKYWFLYIKFGNLSIHTFRMYLNFLWNCFYLWFF